MDTSEIARLRALLAKATPGPWHIGRTAKPRVYVIDTVNVRIADGPCHDDAKLVVAAVNALPRLLDALTGPASADAWRDISTAPTDQTAVDLWQCTGGYYTGGAERIADAFCEGGGRWAIDQRGGHDNVEIDMTFVTHWRPTTDGPAPPAVRRDGGES